ncbi:beta-ketoacyl-[acyl-carrier-protein] synthase family protein [Niabella terrae]
MTRIVVTGIGIITAIGDSAAAHRQSLQEGHSGIGSAGNFHSRYTRLLPFAEIPHTNGTLSETLAITEPGVTRTELIALKACREAIADAGCEPEQLQLPDTALIGASTVGGMCLTDEMYRDANKAEPPGSAFINAYSGSAVSFFLQRQFQTGGIVNTFNTACSSSTNAIIYGARLIRQGKARRAIVGGADALSKFTVNGFNALMILSDSPCRPFDAARKGLNLGEGAAFLVLEKAEDAAGRHVYAELSGYGNSNDAFHPSSTSADGAGPYLSMLRALEVAGMQPGDIDFINAHGTATENNDLTESIAMQRLFDRQPAFASTKSYTGHTLGAAGAVEAIFSMLNLQHQEIYPSLNFNRPIPETGLLPQTAYSRFDCRHVMSNSFGFGGNCSSLIFSKYMP